MDISNYTFITILSIMNEYIEVYLIAFYFWTFIPIELNYDIYNKELAIFKAFKIWQHYLKNLVLLIDIVIN